MPLDVSISDDRNSLTILRSGGGHVLTHNLPHDRRPFIHPIVAPDGHGILTEDSPGHHPWQRGLYTGFNLVNGIGFWREQAGDGRFAPALLESPGVDGDTVRWSVATPWTHPDGALMLLERQHWTLTVRDRSYVLDLDWELDAPIDIEIGRFMAGGLFLRMPYVPGTGARALNSDGLADQDAETKRARWVAVWMPIEGRSDGAGMAIADHPSNPDHPTTWRVDNEFGISPSRVIAGSWTIPAGTIERYRYRVLVFCGSIEPAVIEASWDEFAPGLTVATGLE